MASTTTTLSNTVSIFYDKKFLERAKEMMVYDVGATMKALPRNSGKTVYFNRMSPLAKATTPLTEATNPSDVNMTSTIVSATVAQYGNWVKVGDFYELTSIDEGLLEHVSTLGQNAGETLDELIKDELAGGGTTQLANSVAAVSSIASSDTVDGAEIRKAVRTLKLNKARPFEDNHFKAIIPVSCVYDLRGDSEWLDAHRYTDAENIKNGEIGRLHGVKFHETNNEEVEADAGAGNVDVYSTFIFGKSAYGIVDIGSTSEPIIYTKKPDASSTDNPLNLFMTVGWKANFVAKVLNSDWLIELKSASTVGANS